MPAGRTLQTSRCSPPPLLQLLPLLLLVACGSIAQAFLVLVPAGPPSSSSSSSSMLVAPAITARRCLVPVFSSCSRRSIRTPIRMSSASSTPTVAENLATIRARVKAAAQSAGRGSEDDPHYPRLVAVSKTKPAEALQECYDAGQRHFGENYMHEVLEKAPALPKDIRWHFIGHLQSNKAKPLVTQVPNLWMVETVDSIKLADKLQAAAAAAVEQRGNEPLRVLLQVDTSGEETKSGITADEAVPIAQHILANCPQLKFAGVMTIGAPGDMGCFDRLVEARKLIATATGVEEAGLELSMGMSGDFEEAIARGSTNVRVGSSIFGERDYSAVKKAKAASPPGSPTAAAANEG